MKPSSPSTPSTASKPAPPPGGAVSPTANAATVTPSTAAFVGAFAAIYLIWGSTYLGMRVAIETMPPFAMAGVRFLTAGLIMLAIVSVRRTPWPDARQLRESAIIGVLLLLGGNGSVVWAEQYIPSGITALIIGASPVFFVLTEWAWPGGKRPTLITAGGMALGFAGVAWLAAPWQQESSGETLHTGALITIVLGSLVWAIGSIYTRNVRNPADAFMGAAFQMIFGGLSLLLVAWPHGDFARIDLAAITARSWVAFLYLIVVGSLVGFSTFVWLMKHSTPARVSTYAYVNPVVAVFLGWWILDEPVSTRTLVAAAIIIAAVAIIVTQKSRAKAAATTKA